MRKKVSFCIILAFLIIGSGCANKNPPLEDVANIKIALLKADKADASKYLSKEFEIAKKEFDQVNSLIKEGDYEKAKILSQKVLVDLKLIEKRSVNKKLLKQIETLQKEIDVIKKDIIEIKD